VILLKAKWVSVEWTLPMSSLYFTFRSRELESERGTRGFLIFLARKSRVPIHFHPLHVNMERDTHLDSQNWGCRCSAMWPFGQSIRCNVWIFLVTRKFEFNWYMSSSICAARRSGVPMCFTRFWDGYLEYFERFRSSEHLNRQPQ
jgi:hypothetical protein